MQKAEGKPGGGGGRVKSLIFVSFIFFKKRLSFVFFLFSLHLSSSTEQGRFARCAPGPGAAAWPGSPWGGGRA